MALFYNMLDVAGLAFKLLHSHSMWNNKKSEKRKLFLKKLSMGLAQKQLLLKVEAAFNSTGRLS